VAGESLFEAFIALRVHSEQVAKDVNRGIRDGAKTGVRQAGETAGTSFGSGFKARAGPAFNTAITGLAKTGVATLGVIGVASLKMAGDFQTGLTTLVTGAGESERNLGLISSGVKQIAVDTGTSTAQLIKGLYLIESAGYHGAAGLDVLRAASEGAKVGAADLGDVANAVTTVMTDYALKGPGAADRATNALITTTARGKTHLQDLATSMARILPVAASLGLNMGQVGGAMATMTGEGTSARLAAMGLNATLLALTAPTSGAAKTMKTLGTSSKEVSDALSKHGLAAALDLVTQAARRAGPQGSPAYVAAMKSMLGGTNGLRVALQLTGTHMATLRANTAAVSKSFAQGKTSVTGWALVQEDFNQKLDVLRARAEVAGITLGQKLLPIVSSLLKLFAGNAVTVLIFVGSILGLAVAVKGILGLMKAWEVAQLLWAAVSSSSLVETMALWILYTGVVESAGVATIIATGGIILVVAGLVAGAYLLYKNWGTVWAFVKRVVVDTWTWIKTHWPLLTEILLGPIGFAVVAIIGHWGEIIAGGRAVLAALRPVFSVIGTIARITWLVISTTAKIAFDIVYGVVLACWAIIHPVLNAFATVATWLFRTIIAPQARAAWAVVTAAARGAWVIIQPLLRLFGTVFAFVFNAAGKLAGVVWTAIKEVIRRNLAIGATLVRGLWTVISGVFGFILNGAAKAFSWVPGLGPKLRTAANQFNTFRNQVNGALDGMKNKTLHVNVGFGGIAPGHKVIGQAAEGGEIRGPGGPTSDTAGLYALSNREWVIRANSATQYGTQAMQAVNEGRAVIHYATGGPVGMAAGGGVDVRATLPTAGQINHVVTTAITQMARDWAATFGSGGAIAAYARSFLGRIPYVWGGTAVPGGADCSGFVQAVYRHFGISAPRTSEAQGGWVRRSPPVPGGLAFYNSPAGGPPPGHVAIVNDAGHVISQGGGMGPKLESLHVLPLMWTGIPPGGFPGGAGGRGGNGAPGSVRSWLLQAMNDTGAPLSWLPDLTWMVGKESSGNPRAHNPSGASGLLQTKPGTYREFATVGGGIWDPVSNAVAAIRYIMSRYGSPFRIPGIGTGSYHGYGLGGRIPEDVLGVGASGSRYMFHGGEQVTPAGKPADVATGLEGHLEALIGAVQGLAAGLGMAGTAGQGAARRAAYQSYYSVGG